MRHTDVVALRDQECDWRAPIPCCECNRACKCEGSCGDGVVDIDRGEECDFNSRDSTLGQLSAYLRNVLCQVLTHHMGYARY